MTFLRRNALLPLLLFMLASVAPAFAQSGTGVSLSLAQNNVVAGTRVRLTASPTLSGGQIVEYLWRYSNGRVLGRGASVEFDSTGLTAGTYDITVVGRGSDCREYTDTETLTVVACPPDFRLSSANLRVRAGEVITVMAEGAPSGIDLDWSASAGRLVESGNMITIDTAGIPAGTITVSAVAPMIANCARDIAIAVETPPVALADILSFPMSGGRLNNANKAILDDVSLRSAQDVQARLVITGRSMQGERRGIARTRAENARNYLVNEKGIDPSRIEIRAEEGTAPEGGVQIAIVPPGAQMP